MMSAAINNLFTAALALDAESRRELAERLWDTAQNPEETVLSEEVWQEIGRRVAASDAGHAEHVDGLAALARVRADLGLTVS